MKRQYRSDLATRLQNAARGIEDSPIKRLLKEASRELDAQAIKLVRNDDGTILATTARGRARALTPDEAQAVVLLDYSTEIVV